VHPDSPREQQRQASSRALQQAALRLVDQRGFAAVTVEEIAAEAGTSRRTFFNHFPTKAAALFDPDPSDARRLSELLDAADQAPDPWDALRSVCIALVAEHADVVATRKRLAAASPELDQYHRTAHQHVEIAITDWARRQPSLDPFMAALLAQSAAAVLVTAFATWDADDEPDRLSSLVDAGFRALAAGLGRT
jgi:AcrR family transcriptional regulator